MNNPYEDAREVMYRILAGISPEEQRATIERYYKPDVYFKGQFCEVKKGPDSRERLIKIFQWDRIVSADVKIEFTDHGMRGFAQRDPDMTMYLDISYTARLRYLPFNARATRFIRILQFAQEDGLYYIHRHEDIYQVDDLLGSFLPLAGPVVRVGLRLGTVMTAALTNVGQMLGIWCPRTPQHTENGHAKQD